MSTKKKALKILLLIGGILPLHAYAATLVDNPVLSGNVFANCTGACSNGTVIATGIPAGIYLELSGSGSLTLEIDNTGHTVNYCTYTGSITPGWSFYPCNTGTPSSLTSGGPPNPAALFVNYSSGVNVNMRFQNSSTINARMLVTSTAPITPPTGDQNEVLTYLPTNGVSTSTGVTTVGATFSIAHPEWILGVGYKIIGYGGTELYNASTTVTASSTFSITTNYNFTTPGVVYTGHAYFIQEVNGDPNNIWEIDNPTIQQISIDNPSWTINPTTGAFSPAGTTTISTSTLLAYQIDCPTSFIVGDLCKLAAGLFIPSPGAIQAVQTSFATVLTKAPFSFFTDSKALLNGFRVGTASSGGTFALNLYGSSVPIISTSTAAGIGLNGTPINTLKTLETIGLWIILAWYLYWRIASIFGV